MLILIPTVLVTKVDVGSSILGVGKLPLYSIRKAINYPTAHGVHHLASK
jgi:hypothetical protein